MRQIALVLAVFLLLATCAAYRAQHSGIDQNRARSEEEAREVKIDTSFVDTFESQPIAAKQALLLSQVDAYRAELEVNGQYECCVKPACRQCALTAGECHCREVIEAHGPCCGECTQAWVDGRGNIDGVDREAVLQSLGCVRELYEKKTPEGMTPPGQKKKN